MTFLRRAAGFDRVIGLLLLVALVALKYSDPYPVQFLRLKVSTSISRQSRESCHRLRKNRSPSSISTRPA